MHRQLPRSLDEKLVDSPADDWSLETLREKQEVQ